MRRKSFTILIVCVTALMLLALAACDTFAWLVREVEEEREVTFGNFRVGINVRFDGNPGFVLPNDAPLEVYFLPGHATLPYWGDLRVDITFQGIGEAYLRVKILELWTETVPDIHGVDPPTEYILRAPIGNYAFGSNLWIDNRRVNPLHENDMFVYYHNPASAHDDSFMLSNANAQTVRTIPLITNVTTFAIERPGVRLRLRFRAEAVQRNRYREVWGISGMPAP